MIDSFLIERGLAQVAAYDRTMFVLGTLKLAVEDYGRSRLSYHLVSDMNDMLILRNIKNVRISFESPFVVINAKEASFYSERDKTWHMVLDTPLLFKAEQDENKGLDIDSTISNMLTLLQEIAEKRNVLLYTLNNLSAMCSSANRIKKTIAEYNSKWDSSIRPNITKS